MSVGRIRISPKKVATAKVVLKPASWLAKIDFVAHLILENNVMISLLGEQGSGKTTFATLLQTELNAQIKPYSFLATPSLDRSTLLRQFGALLDGADESSMASLIAQYGLKKEHVLFIIDDAQHLPVVLIEEILSELKQQGSGGYFHVCLVSDFSLVPTLNKLAQDTYIDMIHSIEPGPLSESEIKTYVVQNVLPLPGAENLITDERVQQFYQLTEGRIAKINRQMVDFFSYKPEKQSINTKMMRHVAIAAGVFLAASGIVYIGMSQDIQPAPAQLVALELQSTPDVQLNSEIPGYFVAATRQAVQAMSVRRVELAVSDDEGDSPDESLVVMDKVVVAPKIIQQQVIKKPVAIKKLTQAVVKVPAKRITKTAIIKPVIEQSRYTIQLLASHNINNLKQFAQDYHLNAKTQIRRTQYEGTAWYVLTLGEYTERQHAKQAVNHLPRDIAKFNPWIRLIADLKAAG